MSADVVRLYELFDRAVDLPPDERGELIDELERTDERLASRLVQMLEEDGDGLSTTLGEDVAVTAPVAHLVGKSLGGYAILRELGRGGMGVVFEAQQAHPQRQVALKVIQSGLLSSQGLQRFEREAKILGRVHHPAIAHVYDAGSAELDGDRYPYLVMELIDGVPLDEFVRDHASTREALELFAQVCDAVHSAHELGVVHRDLKPGNILVEAGRPKILDFGVARVTTDDLHPTSAVTATGQIIGTVGYMSPEQLAGQSNQVDARSDVYALGVVLFKLLSGRLPHDVDGKLLPEIIVDVRDGEPLRLGAVAPEFAGDLDTILGKALEKDPDRRYGSAAELAADIRRHLDHEPIAARPPSLAYRAAKFTRRHRGLVAGVGLAFTALLVALAVTSAALVQATRERDAKQVALEASTAMTGFLSELLQEADPYRRGRDVTVREVLDRASSDIGERFERQPYVEAKLRTSLGQAYTGLGLYARAVEELGRAEELWAELDQPPDQDTLATSAAMGSARLPLEQTDAAACEALAAAIERHTDRVPIHEGPLLDTYAAAVRGCTNLSRADLADRLYEEASAAARAAGLGLDDPRLFRLAMARSLWLVIQGQLEPGEAYLRTLVANATRNFGAEHPNTLLAQRYLGTCLAMRGKHEAALDVYAAVYAKLRDSLGPRHYETIIGLCKYARALAKRDRGREALDLTNDTIAKLEAAAQQVPTNLLYAKGVVLLSLDRLREAEVVLAKNLTLELERHDPESIDVALSRLKYGTTLLRLGKRAGAHEQARIGLAIAQRRFPENQAVVGPLETLLEASKGVQ